MKGQLIIKKSRVAYSQYSVSIAKTSVCKHGFAILNRMSRYTMAKKTVWIKVKESKVKICVNKIR